MVRSSSPTKNHASDDHITIMAQPEVFSAHWAPCRHTEDLDLASVNYLHYGASKSWYCIPPAHRPRFEQVLRDQLPDLFRQCPEFFRHKVRMLLLFVFFKQPAAQLCEICAQCASFHLSQRPNFAMMHDAGAVGVSLPLGAREHSLRADGAASRGVCH